MIALLAMLVPPLILVFMRKKYLSQNKCWKDLVMDYSISALALNWLLFTIVNLGFSFSNKGNVFANLNDHSQFASKYIVLAVLFALTEPFVEKFLIEKINFSFIFPKTDIEFKYWKLCVSIYAAALFILNFVRIFDNNFWGDEAFTANLVQKEISEIIAATSKDVHPPLYYVIVRVFYVLFGKQGWAFHLPSLLPCALIIIFSMTAIWRKFGKEVAVILITMVCLSPNAVHFNVEVRMYSWGALFIFLSFYYFYCVIKDNSLKYYLLFAIFSILAAYTHYYCLATISFIYLAHMFIAILYQRQNIKKVIGVWLFSIVAYLPWLQFVWNSLVRHQDNYWIKTIPSFKQSLLYLYSDQKLFYAAIILLLAALAYETELFSVGKKNNGNYVIAFNFTSLKTTEITTLILVGIFAVLGTIVFAISISKLIRPFYVLRYIYPVSTIAWLILGIAVTRLKLKKVYTLLLVIYMISIFFPAYSQTYVREKTMNDSLRTTLKKTIAQVSTEDIILTNHHHIEWTIAKYYYPGVLTNKINLEKLPNLNKSKVYWLIVSGKPKMEETFKQLEAQKFYYNEVIKNGNLGTHNVSIYKLVKTKDFS